MYRNEADGPWGPEDRMIVAIYAVQIALTLGGLGLQSTDLRKVAVATVQGGTALMRLTGSR